MSSLQERLRAQPSSHSNSDPEKTPNIHADACAQDANSGSNDDEKPVHPDTQAGVQNVEAITLVWTKTSLTVAYAMVWVLYFIMLMQQSTLGALTPFVTSAFAQHSLTATVTVVSSIMTGVSSLTIAKLLDVFGRPQGFLISAILATLGLIMMAACNSVELYAAAEVFYQVGQSCLFFSLNVFVADTSSLRNRGFMIAFTSSPNIITSWLSGPISQAYLNGPGWAWAFGTFSILVPVFTLPLFGFLLYNFRKAKKQGFAPEREKKRTPRQAFVHYATEFDAVGLILLTGGLALFLLPFNIYTLQEQGWASPLVICLLVFGVLLMVVFVLWERWFAPVTFLPYALLQDRTVAGACLLGAVLFTSYYCWASFFSSFLMVVVNLDVTTASYVVNTYSVAGTIFCIFVGWIIRHTGHFKTICLVFGISLSILAMGLMIYFRQPDVNVGYIAMCQVILALGFGFVMICDEVAIMAACSHQHIAVLLAIEGMFSNIGGAIGLTVASAIWQSVFPAALAEYLPPEDQPNLVAIYGDLNTQLMYPVGSPTRIAIQQAYGDAQKMMVIAGTAVWALGFVAVLLWRDIDVKSTKQVKGTVF